MKPRDPQKDQIRLRDEYRIRVAQLHAKARANPADKRLIEMEARVLGACEQDLDDLIKGKEHPSDRRS